MPSPSPSPSESQVGVSIPAELARHGRQRVAAYLRSLGRPDTQEQVEQALLSMFVAGWLDWALNAQHYAPPTVTKEL